MKIKQKHLMFLFFIYPILPLGLIAGWFLVMSSYAIIMKTDVYSFENILIGSVFFLWFFGGLVGIYAGLRTLLNHNSKLVFWLFTYASICYAIIAGVYLFEGFQYELKKLAVENLKLRLNIFTLVHLLYISTSLIIIIRQLIHIYRTVFGLPSKQGQPTPDIENAH